MHAFCTYKHVYMCMLSVHVNMCAYVFSVNLKKIYTCAYLYR